jgi:hypothetical protein
VRCRQDLPERRTTYYEAALAVGDDIGEVRQTSADDRTVQGPASEAVKNPIEIPTEPIEFETGKLSHAEAPSILYCRMLSHSCANNDGSWATVGSMSV